MARSMHKGIIMKLKTILFIVLLSGCGVSESPLDAEGLYDELMACSGLSADMPDISIVDDLVWPINKKKAAGVYYQDVEQIIIRKSERRNQRLLKHELLHHLLYKNYNDPDSCHADPLFSYCTNDLGKKC